MVLSIDRSVQVFCLMEKSDYVVLKELLEHEQRDAENNGSFKLRSEAIVTESRDYRVEKPALSIFTGSLTNRHVWKFVNLSNLCQNY